MLHGFNFSELVVNTNLYVFKC